MRVTAVEMGIALRGCRRTEIRRARDTGHLNTSDVTLSIAFGTTAGL